MQKATDLTKVLEPSSAWLESYEIAWDNLTKVDVSLQCKRSGSKLLDDPMGKRIELPFIHEDYTVNISEKTITCAEKDIPLWEKIVILHYLIEAKGTPLKGTSITFKEVPGGNVYYPAFIKRAKFPLEKNFGNKSTQLVELGQRIGGTKENIGDASVTIHALPKVPITLIIWKGDEEFPAEGNILYDATIPDYLPTEDIAVVSGFLVGKLIKIEKSA
ncbi:MAG: DUF3786 domain-containing protein [Thermodesulfobacteriota bacterium]|nr:DUF3786 domain-containing protein [Thermodesulfobacteriota bacterium]